MGEGPQPLAGESGADAPGYYAFARVDLVDFLSKHVPMRGHVLDIGCSEGRFGQELLRHGFDSVTGIEPFAAAAESARSRLTSVVHSTLEDADLTGAGTFELIAFADSLEHMVDPWAALDRVRPLLGDDGALLLSVPNVAHWSVLWRALQLGRWDYEPAGILDRTHLRFFTPATIRESVEAAGYRVIATGGSGEDVYPLPKRRRWMRPLIVRFWPHVLVYQSYLLAVPRERQELA